MMFGGFVVIEIGAFVKTRLFLSTANYRSTTFFRQVATRRLKTEPRCVRVWGESYSSVGDFLVSRDFFGGVVSMTSLLAGKVALVTGGSRGIGRAVCVELAAQGATVWINYASRSDAAEETAALCEEKGAVAKIVPFQVEDSEAVDKAIDRIKAESGRLDIVVNNAGISRDGLFVRMKNADWEQTIQTNLTGAFYVARAAARLMMKQREGRIINISSVVGEMGNAGQVPYVSSKAGMLGLTKAMARELSSRNVTVNAITPGFIDTEMTQVLPEAVREEHLKAIPLARFGQPREVAALVAYITGQVIGVNGGMYM
jgi:3-oxoacyl-[acyl-carrier protein] reductase